MKTILTLFTFSLIAFSLIGQAHTIHYHAGGPLEIIKIGHPTLTMIAEEIPFDDISVKDTQELIDDMIITMKKAGGVGLAAPQVNVSKRLFVIKPSLFKKAEAIINPTIDYVEDQGTKNSNEGCLSIPGRTFNVTRYNKINVTYFNRQGEYVTESPSGFRAVVFQHEYDHLNGILISDFFNLEFIEDKNWQNVPRM